MHIFKIKKLINRQGALDRRSVLFHVSDFYLFFLHILNFFHISAISILRALGLKFYIFRYFIRCINILPIYYYLLVLEACYFGLIVEPKQ